MLEDRSHGSNQHNGQPAWNTHRLGRTDLATECGNPVADGRRVVIGDVVDAAASLHGTDGRRRCIIDMDEGEGSLPGANNGKHTAASLSDEIALRVEIRAGAIQLAIAENDTLDPIR